MIFQQFTSNKASILIWELTESIDDLIVELRNFELYKNEFLEIRTEKRRREFLCVRIAMNKLANYECNISYDDFGKPFLNDKTFEISVSHSGKWIAVICHPTQKVGIDIECPSEKIQKVYKRFLSEIEQKDLSGGQNLQQLYLAWSAKEALFKIIGNEAVDFAKQLRILPFEVKKVGKFEAVHLPSNSIYILNYLCYTNFNLVYCIDNN